MKDLAPEIFRQRAVIEGRPNKELTADEIKKYLKGLSKSLQMRLLMNPVTHRSPKFNEAAWVHWETSGAHFYAWDKPALFFSVDIYTCKPFDIKVAVSYTKKFFSITELEYMEY